MKVYIDWEHGSASINVERSYEINENDIHEFLDFVFDLMGWRHSKDLVGIGYFEDGHYERITEHVENINKKYDFKFESFVEVDVLFTNYRPAIYSIWLKFGNKRKYIVWKKCLDECIISVPKPGDTLLLTTGEVSGHGKHFGLSSKETLWYEDFIENGFQIENINTLKPIYAPIQAEVVKVMIDFGEYSRYRTNFTHFNYLILCKHNLGLFTTQVDGYDPTITIKEDFLFFH